MTTNQTIDGVPRECKACGGTSLTWFAQSENKSGVQEGRLRTHEVSSVFVLGCDDCSETLRVVSADKMAALLNNPAAQPQGEPVALTAVGVLRDDGDGGLEPEWILEGGTAELWAVAVLLIADEDQELCAEDGHCELYRAPAEQPAPVAVVPERLVMTDGLHTYEYVTGHNAAIDKMLGVKP